MANSSVLREFLVKIGFKVDETKYRDFQEAMRATAKNAVEMSKTTLAAATVMGAGLRQVAQQMEGLYFATRRTGASATELKELGFAAEQLGVSAEQARNAVEGLAAARRTNPGLNGILGGLGIDPRQIDNAKVLIELLARLRSMPYYQGAQMAGMFGINEQTFAMLEQGLPEMQKYLALRDKMYRAAGINADHIANRSHEFNTHLRIFEATLGNLADIIAYRLMPWGEKVIDWITSVVGWLTKADGATRGWSSRLLGIGTALASGSLIKGGLGVLGKLLGRGAAGEAAAGAGESAAAAGGGLLTVTSALVAAAVGLALIVFNRGIADKVRQFLGLPEKIDVAPIKQAAQHVATYIPKVTGALARMTAHFEGFRANTYRDVAGYATRFFGHRVAPGENLDGADPVAVLNSDLGKALMTVHRLVKRHLSSNQENALADFIFNVGEKGFASSTLLRKLNAGDYAGAADQFQYWNHALVNGHLTTLKALTSRRAAEANLFRTPDRPVTITQKADYHINSTDPHGAASEVERRQRAMTADLVRNFAGAIQ
jgi:GH24 family phage-related lysozyme (muramidase)